jgi:hypothetical protein
MLAALRSQPHLARNLALAALLGSAFWAWALWPRFTCGGLLPDCASLVALVVGSAAYGTALGIAYTSLSLVLAVVFNGMVPEHKKVKAPRAALAVSALLFGLQALLVGGIAVAGALPNNWAWWLGIWGALLA